MTNRTIRKPLSSAGRNGEEPVGDAIADAQILGLDSYRRLQLHQKLKLEQISREFERQVDRLVAQRIRERRGLLDMTQQELADRVGIAPQQVHRYERGESRVTAGRLAQFAESLRVPITYFFTMPASPTARRRRPR